MPLGFTPGMLTGIQARGNEMFLQGLQQLGQNVQANLERVTTTRQLEGLATSLGQLNPETPDYPQKLIQLGGAFPFAMRDPRGQAMMKIGADANAQWQQSRRIMQQNQMVMNRQSALQGIRHQDAMELERLRQQGRGNEMMDLEQPLALPSEGTMPPPGFSMAAGMPGVGAAIDASRSAAINSGVSGKPLYGSDTRVLPPVAGPGTRVRESLLGAGISRLPAKEFRSAVASEIRGDRQRAMQEDRQAASEAAAAKRVEVSEAAAEKRATEAEKGRVATEERTLRGMNATSLRQERTGINTRRNAIKRELDSGFDEEMETNEAGKPLTKEQTAYFKKRKLLADELAGLDAEYENLTKELEALGGTSKSSPALRFDPSSGKLVPR